MNAYNIIINLNLIKFFRDQKNCPTIFYINNNNMLLTNKNMYNTF